MKKPIKILLPCLLALLLVLATLTPSLAAKTAAAQITTLSPASSASKEEVVYANLNNDGTVKQIYVVNVFESPEGGTIKDRGDYESVVNLTDTSEIALSGSELSFTMGPGRFYYQGNMKSTQLPWDIDISYSLDGATLSPEDIAGKSGKLEISINTKGSGYSSKAFYENYMLQVSLTLDTSRCREISAKGATIANAGKNKLVNFTVMPNAEGKIKVSADVTNFEMEPIQITAIPLSLSMEIPETGSISEELSPLSDAIRQLRDGADLLSDGIGELKDGFAGFNKGLTELRGGSAGFLSGMKALTEQSPALTQGSAMILEGLKTLSASLETGDLSGLAALSELPGALSELSKATDTASAGLKELEAAFSQGYDALAAAIENLPSQPLDASVLAALSTSTDQNVLALLGAYQGQLEAIMRLKATFAGLRQLFDGVSPALSQTASGLSEITLTLRGITAALKSSMGLPDLGEATGGLKSGIDMLVTSFESFHQGLAAFTGGVGELGTAYLGIDAGLGSLSDASNEILTGLNELQGGASELSEGTAELYSQTSDLDSLISDKIEEFISGYDKSDFKPTSFVTPERDVSSVQFVLKTAGISLPEQENTAPAAAEKPTFWRRLLNLFGL